MSEVDDISQGLGTQLRVLFSAALALAQIAAQRRAAQLREQAAATGVAEQEARRRFETEQRVAALGIPLPEANMTPQQVAQAWAKAEVARAHAPEVAEFWDQQARTVGVDPEGVRAQWWREHTPTREDPGAYRAAVTGLGVEVAAAVADADRAQAQQREEAAERERRAGRADGVESLPVSPGVWQDGHPPARLAGQSYAVAPGKGTAPARRRSRTSGRGMAAAKQREHGLDR